MKVAVVDHGYNIEVLKWLFENDELLREHRLESVEAEPIVVYFDDSQRGETVERTRPFYDNADRLVVPYKEGLERIKALADDIGVLVTSYNLGREGAGLDLISAVRKGDLGERLQGVAMALIADFGDPLSSHRELDYLRINLVIDYIINERSQDALLELVRKVKETK